MIPVPGTITLANSDITSQATQAKVKDLLQGNLADLIISDIAPNATGIKSMDHERIVALCRVVIKFAQIFLNNEGTLLIKIWQGAEQNRLEALCKQIFAKVTYVKPHASRTDSAEIYLLSQYFRRLS